MKSASPIDAHLVLRDSDGNAVALLGAVLVGPESALTAGLQAYVAVSRCEVTICITRNRVTLVRGDAAKVFVGDALVEGGSRCLANGPCEVRAGDSIQVCGNSFTIADRVGPPVLASTSRLHFCSSPPHPSRARDEEHDSPVLRAYKRVVAPTSPPMPADQPAAEPMVVETSAPDTSTEEIWSKSWQAGATEGLVPAQECLLRARFEAFVPENVKFLGGFISGGLGRSRLQQAAWAPVRSADGSDEPPVACFFAPVAQADWTSRQKTLVVGIAAVPASSSLQPSFLPVRSFGQHYFALRAGVGVAMPKLRDETGSETHVLVFPSGALGVAHAQLSAALRPEVEAQVLATTKGDAAKRLVTARMRDAAFWM